MNCTKSELQTTLNKIIFDMVMINGKEPLIVKGKISRLGQVNFFVISFQLSNILKSYWLEINCQWK